MTLLPLTVLAIVMSAALCGQEVGAVHRHGRSSNEAAAPVVVVSGLRIPDVALKNQRGETVHFYSDLIKGRIAAINTVFTTCTTICPIMGANFANLQKSLTASGRHDVSLISISVDPVVDTPERLAEWIGHFGKPDSGWTLLTGSKPEVETVLKALQVFQADKNEHAPVVLIGGGTASDWVRASALLPPSRLTEVINHRFPRTEALH